MRFNKLKLITVSVFFLLGSQSANVLAETAATTPQPSEATTGSTGAATSTTATAQTPQVYPGYRSPRHHRNHRRGWVRPFGDDGPGFRDPWRKGRGSGFGFGSGSGPSWDSGRAPDWRSEPRFRSLDDRDRDRFFDAPFMGDPFNDPFYDRDNFYDRGPRDWDRGPRFRDMDWDSRGMSFGW